MTTLSKIQAASTANGEISLNDLLYELKVTQRLKVLEEALQDALILREVQKQRITVDDAELQQEADALRGSMGLHSASDTHAWLRERAMTENDLENYLTRLLASAKLKERLTAGKIESYFASNRASYDSARIKRIVVESADLADQVVKQLKSGKADFEALALEYSADRDTRERGGAVGRVLRPHLAPEVAAAVFLASPGDLVGPIRVGATYHIVRVESVTRAKLDAETSGLVKDAIFRSWLEQQAKADKVKFELPKLISSPA